MENNDKHNESKNNEENSNVILLNKAFIGSWNDEEGHISHEIINFFKADDGNYYVFFSPYGTVNDDVYVDDGEKGRGEKGKKGRKPNDRKYKAEYLLIASNATLEDNESSEEGSEESSGEGKKTKGSKFYIKYIIKLKNRITNNSGITYGGKSLIDIFNVDEKYPVVTFEAENIYDTTNSKNNLVTTTEYIYQRHRGYLYKDKYECDFKNLLNQIETLIQENERDENKSELIKTIDDWEKSNPSLKNIQEQQKTFIDFIGKKDDENIYSNILFEILKVGGIFSEFCKYVGKIPNESNEINESNGLKKSNEWPDLSEEKFDLTREKFVQVDKDKGRIDIYAESEKYGIFIENKILSDLNGMKINSENNKESQITLYYKWVKEIRKKEVYGILLVPDYRENEIKAELEAYKESSLVKIVTYKQIADFFDDNIINVLNMSAFKYLKYTDEIKNIFYKHGYSDKLEKFAVDFINAINNCKNNNDNEV